VKYLSCLALILVASFADAAPFAWVVTDTDSRVVAALASASRPAAKPVCRCAATGECTCAAGKCNCLLTAKNANCPCGITDCPCGCCEGKACTCGTKSEYAEFVAWKASKARPHPELSKPYAKAWMADGWTFDEEKGYWSKYPPQCADGTCAPQSYAPQMQFYQPQMMQSFGGFGGGGGGGCSGGG